MSSVLVLEDGDVMRILYATLAHLDAPHLFYNMVSFLLKGKTLEQRYGLWRFALIICAFTLLQSILFLGMQSALAWYLDEPLYRYQCALGFSGVIFALKVLTHHLLSGPVYFVGIVPVPSRWALWLELIMIQLLLPGASFLGHLAGILAGMLVLGAQSLWPVIGPPNDKAALPDDRRPPPIVPSGISSVPSPASA